MNLLFPNNLYTIGALDVENEYKFLIDQTNKIKITILKVRLANPLKYKTPGV